MTKQIFLRKKSKRMTCKKRYKIVKKVAEHKRKVRKVAKKAGNNKPKTKPLEQQIPNSCPFKEEILIEAVKRSEVAQAEKQIRREQVKQARVKARTDAVAQKRKLKMGASTLQELADKAKGQQRDFDNQATGMEECEPSVGLTRDKSTRTYVSEVKKVIEQADVILEVLDARDPLGSRCAALEEMVLSEGKKLVLLINKIDLVPKENIEKWLTYLRRQMPTLAFRASTQEQKKNLGRSSKTLSSSGGSKCIGADLLLKLMGNYCRNKDIKTTIRVGVVGFPNVGKSSIINSLKRSKTCSVGATPGVTKNIQEIELDSNVRLLDSPGVVLVSKSSLDPVEVALKNAVRVENLSDPALVVEAILRRCSKDTMMLQYGIPEFSDTQSFLVNIARRFGLLKRGAMPDLHAAAKRILVEWNTGKLKYYTVPPETPVGDKSTSAIVTQMAKEFNIEEFHKDENKILMDLEEEGVGDYTLFNSKGVVSGDLEQSMQIDVNPTVVVYADQKSDVSASLSALTPKKISDTPVLDGNSKLESLKKSQLKKKKKRAKRADKLATELSSGMEKSMDLDEPYNFEDHF